MSAGLDAWSLRFFFSVVPGPGVWMLWHLWRETGSERGLWRHMPDDRENAGKCLDGLLLEAGSRRDPAHPCSALPGSSVIDLVLQWNTGAFNFRCSALGA